MYNQYTKDVGSFNGDPIYIGEMDDYRAESAMLISDMYDGEVLEAEVIDLEDDDLDVTGARCLLDIIQNQAD